MTRSRPAATLGLALALATPPPGAQEASFDPVALGDFLYEAVPRLMRADHVPGAALVVVADGELVFADGFGVSSLATDEPVDVERTLFRIGSITKVFTALGVAQLVDRGKLAWDDPVAPWLGDLEIESRFDEPVRIRHLVTHTAGFDQIGTGRHASGPATQLGPGAFLEGRLHVVRPPGETTCYDTYGITLAGYVLERVSGLSYAEYLRRHVFGPLGMERTSVQATPDLRKDLAVGYGLAGTQAIEQVYEYYDTTPASSIDATATDMARLMLALLGDGSVDDGHLLSEEATARALAPQHRNHPELPGFTHGMFEELRAGVRAVHHGGSMAGFNASMYLLPDHGLGFFVACNRDAEQAPLRFPEELRRQLLERWFGPPPTNPDGEPASVDVAPLAGPYANSGYCHTCPDGVGWEASPFEVEALGKGLLGLWGARWRAVDGSRFLEVGGSRRLVFRKDPRSGVQRFFFDNATYERLDDALVREVRGPEAKDAGPAHLAARLARLTGRWSEAAAAYARLAEAGERPGRSHHLAGEAHLRAGAPAEALPHLARSHELGQWPALSAFLAGVACASQDDVDGALDWLGRAVDGGFADPGELEREPRLAALRDHPRFGELLGRLRPAPAPGGRIEDRPVPAGLRAELAGRYAYLPRGEGLEARVADRGGRLFLELPGTTPIRLLHQGAHEFRWSIAAGARMVFDVHEGTAAGFTVLLGNRDFRAERLADR